jgi:oligosaccharyltransferase complex subunit gamma
MMKTSFTKVLAGLLFASSIQAASSTTKHAQFLRQAHTSPDKILDVKGTQEFDDLIASPRNYSVSLLLTAVDSGVQCGPCTAFQPTYQNLARSYGGLKKEATSRHLFANLEFKNGREVFQKLKLQYAPVLLFFPATAGPYASTSANAVTFDFNRLGFEGKDVADELSKQLGITVPYNRPFQWKLFATAATSTLILSTTLYALIPKLLATKSFNFGLVWNVLIQMAFLATIVIMCAGQMWNSIRNAPYLQMNAAGKPEYFAGGFQNQYGAETHIVAVVCE